MRSVRSRPRPSDHMACDCKTVGQLETDVERQLLAGDRVDERLERCWKSWRFEAAELACERSQENPGPPRCRSSMALLIQSSRCAGHS